jgi:rhodanese-related sulfurtransferase
MTIPKNTFLFKIIVLCSIAIFVISTLFLSGCSEVLAKKEPVQLSVEKVDEILKNQKDNYIILDVRAKEEFDLGHLDSAMLIPVDELETRFGELSKDKPIIVYCRSGKRSATAAAILVSKGFSPVYDMTGGINAWTGKGYPVIVENSGSTNVTAGSSTSSEISGEQITDQAAGQSSNQAGGQENSQGSNQESTQQSGNTASAGETLAVVEVNYISADELNAKVTKGEAIIILDVRSEDSFKLKHIKNAVNIPYIDLEGRTGELDGSKEIIVYCSNSDCGLSVNAFNLLKNAGFKNVYALEGGIESWQYNGYPVE